MIRPATPQDASRLAEILIFAKRCAYRPIFRNDQVSFNAMSVLDLALTFRDDPEAIRGFFVYDDGIVRATMKVALADDAGHHAQLEALYVDPFFQGQGFGGKLMDAFLKMAAQRKAASAFLWVLEKNTSARVFYTRFGFRWDGARRLEPETPEYLLRYSRALK